jgi:hypothetical protein
MSLDLRGGPNGVPPLTARRRTFRELLSRDWSDVPSARGLAEGTRCRFPIKGPPYCPHEYAAALGIPVERRPIPTDGFLLDWPGPDARIILKDLGPAADVRQRRRQNFTLAHELGHIVLRKQLIGLLDPTTGYTLNDPDEERFCDKFASHLLLPDRSLRTDLQTAGVGPSALLAMCERYDVSLGALVRSAAAIAGPSSMMVVLWTLRAGRFKPQWFWPSRFARALLVDTGKSTVERAFSDGGEHMGRDQVLLQGRRESWQCASRLLGTKNKVLMVGVRANSHLPIKGERRSAEVEQLSLFRSARSKRYGPKNKGLQKKPQAPPKAQTNCRGSHAQRLAPKGTRHGV